MPSYELALLWYGPIPSEHQFPWQTLVACLDRVAWARLKADGNPKAERWGSAPAPAVRRCVRLGAPRPPLPVPRRVRGGGGRAHGRQRQQRGWPGQPAPSLPGARATPAQPASGGGCLPQPRWAVCATGAGAHQGQTSREGEKDIWWTARTTRGGKGHLGLTHTETQRGRLRTACGQRRVGSKNSQTTPTTTSTSSIRQLLGAADAQRAHHATFSTALAHQLLGSANAETTPAGAPAATADRTQRPDATCEGENGGLSRAP